MIRYLILWYIIAYKKKYNILIVIEKFYLYSIYFTNLDYI